MNIKLFHRHHLSFILCSIKYQQVNYRKTKLFWDYVLLPFVLPFLFGKIPQPFRILLSFSVCPPWFPYFAILICLIPEIQSLSVWFTTLLSRFSKLYLSCSLSFRRPGIFVGRFRPLASQAFVPSGEHLCGVVSSAWLYIFSLAKAYCFS